ncbi:MAG: hypothetical protein HY537_01925 [Deltaproteobacteria bacterium]|nr:hypothetical protein [Deltaproteobacteria bacterium]
MNKRCGECGSTDLKLKKNQGPFPWKDFPMVFINTPVQLLTCRCGNYILRHEDIGSLDKKIENSIKEQTQSLIDRVLEREHCSQVELAQRIGITPQHLCALKSGAKTAGFQTFNFLKILALDEKAFKVADPQEAIGKLKKAAG